MMGSLSQKRPRVYRIQEFARRAGVTVRALHHYDRLGLLRPSGRSDRGYRLYRDCDLARLEQIVVLKFLGLPLKQIGRLLKREAPLSDTLRRQQQVLAEQRRQLDVAIHAIGEAERSVQSRREPDWELFKTIVKEIEMQNNTEWTINWASGSHARRSTVSRRCRSTSRAGRRSSPTTRGGCFGCRCEVACSRPRAAR
jgi:DNA-binding transcriptional MerR regulator